jgi:hypothetical protein
MVGKFPQTRHHTVFIENYGELSDVNSGPIEEWIAKLPFCLCCFSSGKTVNSEYCNIFLFSVMFA